MSDDRSHPSSILRRDLLKGMAALPLVGLAASAARAATPATAAVNSTGLAVTDDSVTVGILHSITGTMAISEIGAVEAEKLAISEINASGGILGRQIKIIQEDGASDWPTFAEKARKLLISDKCASVYGCFTSASRKAVLPVFEEKNGLLYYPTFYEGLEQSKNVIYTGQEATQQTIAVLNWLAKAKGAKSFYFVGSDYIWPRTSNKIARKHIDSVIKGKVVGEDYFPLGATAFNTVINKDQAEEARRHLLHRRRRLQRVALQADEGRRHRHVEAACGRSRGDRRRDPRHRRRELRERLQLHEVLPVDRHARQQGLRRRLPEDVGRQRGSSAIRSRLPTRRRSCGKWRSRRPAASTSTRSSRRRRGSR